MQEHLIPETPTTAPTLTICLTSEQVDTLIFALEHSHVWSWEMGLKQQTPVQHYESRRVLLENLRAWVDPSEMTAEEILAREG